MIENVCFVSVEHFSARTNKPKDEGNGEDDCVTFPRQDWEGKCVLVDRGGNRNMQILTSTVKGKE